MPNIHFYIFYQKKDFSTQTLGPPKNHVKNFKIKNQMLPLKPQYNRLYFINILFSPNFCTFSDTEPFVHPYPTFSALPNLTFLTSETQNLRFDKFLPCALSQPKMNQKSPKNPKSILILTMKLL